MASAAKKQHRIKAPVRSTFDPETGKFEAFIVKMVVEEVEDPLAEVVSGRSPGAESPTRPIGEEIRMPISTDGTRADRSSVAPNRSLYQRIREAEREKDLQRRISSTGSRRRSSTAR